LRAVSVAYTFDGVVVNPNSDIVDLLNYRRVNIDLGLIAWLILPICDLFIFVFGLVSRLLLFSKR